MEMDQDRENGLPVDRGWAWVVMAGSAIIYFCYAGVLKSFGILFVEFLKKYQESAAVTSLVTGLESGCFTVASMLCLTVGLRYASVRTIAMFGGFMVSFSFVLSSFAGDIYFLLVSYSVIFGIGHGMVTGPILCILGDYFDTRRSTANGLTMSACSIGGLLFAPLCRYLLDEYGLQGTLLIFGGILLHCFLAGALFRPIDFYSIEKRKQDKKKKLKRKKRKTNRRNDKAKTSNVKNGNMSNSLPLLDTEDAFRPRSPTADSTFSPLARRAMLKRMRSRTDSEANTPEQMSPSLSPKEEVPSRSRAMSETTENTGRRPRESSFENAKPALAGVGRYFSNESLMNIALASSAGFKTSRESIKSRKKTLSDSSSTNEPDKQTSHTSACHGIFNFRIFRNLSFALFAPSYWLASVASSLPVIYIPAQVEEHGIYGQRAALLLSIIGAFDAVGRFMAGFIADQFHVNPRYLIILAMTVNGIAQLVLVLLGSSYWPYVIFCVVYGIFAGFLYSLYAAIVLRMVGKDDFRSTLTVLMIGQGAAYSISNPIIGVLKDVTGSYVASFQYMGVSAIVAVILFTAEAILTKVKSSRQKQTDIEMSSNELT